LEGLPDSRSWVEAAQRVDNYIRKSDDLILEMAKNNQTLWETMGLIRFLFTPSIELDVHLKEVEQILTSTQPRIAVIESEFKTVEGKDVDSLKNETYRDFNALISEHIDKPMENLAKYLKQEVDAEAAKIRVLWTNSENILKNPQYCRDCKLFCSTKTCPLKPPSQEEIKKKG
jgi:hypothetical protein